jgi:hypothetical protein
MQSPKIKISAKNISLEIKYILLLRISIPTQKKLKMKIP